MKTVYLHGKLGKRFGKKWKLSVGSAQEAYSAIEANTEGFFEYIFNAAKNGTEYIALTKNPKHIKDENDLRENIIDLKNKDIGRRHGELHLINLAAGSIPGLGTAIMNFFFVSGTVASGMTLHGMIVATIALTAITQALTKPPKPPERKDPISTKSFLIAGGSTRQAQGIAVPVGYGRLKIGCANVAVRRQSERLSDYTPEKADLLESYTKMEFIDLISEGPIHGFVDSNGVTINGDDITEAIYLNDVQVKNASGSLNYVMNENIDNRSGRPRYKLGQYNDSTILSDGVFYIKEYDNLIYGPPPYGELRYGIQGAIENDAKVISHFISNPAVNEVTISFRAEISSQADDGQVNPNNVAFAILITREGQDFNILEPKSSGCKIVKIGDGVQKVRNFSAFNEAFSQAVEYTNPNDAPNGMRIAQALINAKTAKELAGKYSDVDQAHFELSGIATSAYQFDITFQIDREYPFNDSNNGLTIKILKLSPEYDPSVKGGDFGGIAKTRRLQLSHVEEKINENLLYPHSAMVRILVDSKNFSNVPDRKYHVKLKKVLIPSNYDPVSRKYDGPWDGLFLGQSDSLESIHSISDEDKKWTDNPAWVFFDLLHNTRYGVGKYGLDEENIDKWQLYKIAKYCDQLVETDYHVETASQNPRRFSCNNSLIDSQDQESGKMEIKIYQGEYNGQYVQIDASKNYQVSSSVNYEITDEQKSIFKHEFGGKHTDSEGNVTGESFKGKKIAFFIHKPSGNISDDEKAFRSVVRDGEIQIEERVIIDADPDNFIVTVSGPALSQEESETIGACATQINHPLVEPRFSANLYLTDRAEAFEVIKNLASIFRGMSAYSGGKILAVQDSFKSPIQLFTNSNVDKEGFSYSGVHKNKRVSASLVRFNNSTKSYRPDLVYEEDADAIQKFGYIENETMGLGITSESQARRMAKWILLTSQLETETINFTAGQEASYLFPGSVFEISDENRVGKSKSGRILDIGNSRNLFLNDQQYSHNDPYILLDKSIEDDPVLSKAELTVCVGLSNSSQENVELRSKFEKSQDDQDAEINAITTPQIYKFKASIAKNDNVPRGPQGQRTIAYNLLLKLPFEPNVEKNTIEKYEHGFEIGDKISFDSDGVLPGGLNSEYIYFVINTTKHTFQVSEDDPNIVSANAVNILDTGRDNLLNTGGNHYFSPYREPGLIDTKTQEAIDQLSVGATYSIKGYIGATSNEPLRYSGFRQNLKISGELGSGLFESDVFGTLFISSNDGWMYSNNLNQWINAKGIMDYGLGGDNSWFFCDSLGWVWIMETEDDYFWYLSKLDIFIFTKSKAAWFFYYDNNPTVSSGDSISLVESTIFIKNVATGSPSGYFFSFLEKSNEYTTSSPTNSLSGISAPSSPGFKSSLISEIIAVEPEDSPQGLQGVRIVLENGHGLDIVRNNKINISGFFSDNVILNDQINTEWFTIYINNNAIELIKSNSIAPLIDASIISQNGNINFTESAKSEVERYLEGQLFRTLSVKEVSEGKYEVVGLEYNASKFNAVDSKGVIKKPHLPIPPQADMSIPDAPTNLILNDLTL